MVALAGVAIGPLCKAYTPHKGGRGKRQNPRPLTDGALDDDWDAGGSIHMRHVVVNPVGDAQDVYVDALLPGFEAAVHAHWGGWWASQPASRDGLLRIVAIHFIKTTGYLYHLQSPRPNPRICSQSLHSVAKRYRGVRYAEPCRQLWFCSLRGQSWGSRQFHSERHSVLTTVVWDVGSFEEDFFDHLASHATGTNCGRPCHISHTPWAVSSAVHQRHWIR